MGWVQLDVMSPQKQLQETFNAYGGVEVLPRYNIPRTVRFLALGLQVELSDLR
jgi:hypothetical protein